MYSLLRSQTWKSLLITQLPGFAAAMLIAELFYKFKSFSLECLAFLATWFVLDWVRARLRAVFSPVPERSGN